MAGIQVNSATTVKSIHKRFFISVISSARKYARLDAKRVPFPSATKRLRVGVCAPRYTFVKEAKGMCNMFLFM